MPLGSSVMPLYREETCLQLVNFARVMFHSGQRTQVWVQLVWAVWKRKTENAGNKMAAPMKHMLWAFLRGVCVARESQPKGATLALKLAACRSREVFYFFYFFFLHSFGVLQKANTTGASCAVKLACRVAKPTFASKKKLCSLHNFTSVCLGPNFVLCLVLSFRARIFLPTVARFIYVTLIWASFQCSGSPVQLSGWLANFLLSWAATVTRAFTVICSCV